MGQNYLCGKTFLFSKVFGWKFLVESFEKRMWWPFCSGFCSIFLTFCVQWIKDVSQMLLQRCKILLVQEYLCSDILSRYSWPKYLFKGEKISFWRWKRKSSHLGPGSTKDWSGAGSTETNDWWTFKIFQISWSRW